MMREPGSEISETSLGNRVKLVRAFPIIYLHNNKKNSIINCNKNIFEVIMSKIKKV
jgi:hypothetical protein